MTSKLRLNFALLLGSFCRKKSENSVRRECEGGPVRMWLHFEQLDFERQTLVPIIFETVGGMVGATGIEPMTSTVSR